jgi:hypothetical protein
MPSYLRTVRHNMRAPEILVVLALSVVGCGVADAANRGGECVEPAATADSFVKAARDAIPSNDRECLETVFLNAKILPADSRLAEIGKRLLDEHTRGPGASDGVRVAVISYLMFATQGHALDLLKSDLAVVRRAGQDGPSDIRTASISLLSTRRSNDDLEIFTAGIASGDEGVLAESMFALADNCSPAAIDMLKEKLKSRPVLEYLKKYSKKESITATIKGSCPAALD